MIHAMVEFNIPLDTL